MELDHIILERICLRKYSADADRPVPINLRDWHVYPIKEYLAMQREEKLKEIGI